MELLDNEKRFTPGTVTDSFRVVRAVGPLPDKVLRGVNPATEAEILKEKVLYGECFIDSLGRIVNPEFVFVDRSGCAYAAEKVKDAMDALAGDQGQAANTRRYTVIDKLRNNGKIGKRPLQPQVNRKSKHAFDFECHMAAMEKELAGVKGMPRPKLITTAVWQALAYQGVLK